MIESYLLLVAEEVRGQLAALGLRSFDEAIGRCDLLAPARATVDGRAACSTSTPCWRRPPG